MHKELIGNTEFTFELADKSEKLMDEVYHLRYLVYCKECHFIKEEEYPDGTEKDKYDPYSLHFVTEDPESVIGTSRLILDNPNGFLLEEYCKDGLTSDISKMDRQHMAEISRLAISKSYRRRRNDGLYYSADYNEEERSAAKRDALKRLKPMTFGLYREMYQECKRRGITHFLALMEKTLWMLLNIHHFEFHPIGKGIDVYGPVRPYMADIKEMEKIMCKKAPHLLGYFLDGLEPAFHPNLPQ